LVTEHKEIYVFTRDIDVNLLRNSITLIDGYLTNYFDDPAPYRHKIRAGALGPQLAKEWKRIERALMKIATSVRRIPALRSIVKLCTFLKILALMFMVSGTTLAISASFQVGEAYFYYLSLFFLTFSGISTIWHNFLQRKMSVKITEYFEEHKSKYQFTRRYLKGIVQKLIFSMGHYLKTRGEDPEKYPLSLYNKDYAGIKVVKETGLFRSRYKVIVATS